MINSSKLTEEFHSLPNNKEPQTLKQLNLYIRKIRENIQNQQDLDSYARSIQTKNAVEHAFKIEILLQLRCTDQLLDELKTADAISIKRIVKSKGFLSDAFANMRCEVFFNTLAPYVAHDTFLKILNRLPSILDDSKLSCEYFDALLPKHGINIAGKVLLACDIDYIKYNVEKYNIHFTCDELLLLAQRDKHFLRFYFKVNSAIHWKLTTEYQAVVRFIGKTDADFFWELYELHQFNRPNIEIRLGEDVFDNLFTNNEEKATDREICVDMFEPRVVFNVLIRRDKLHVLLANFCHGGEDEFYEIYCQNEGRLFYSIHSFLEDAPKYRYFYFLNKAYNWKFGKDLVDNPKLFNEQLLQVTPKKEREMVLDVLTLKNPNLFYLYSIEKSIPILKEKLEMDKDNTGIYLKQLYQTCRFYKDENVLLEILNYILQKYRHEEKLLNEIVGKVVEWPNSEKLKPEIWKALDMLTEIIEYSDEIVSSKHFDRYLRNHIINSVNCNIPFDNFFKVLLHRRTNNFLQFGSNKNNKLYYEITCKLIYYMYKKEDVKNDVNSLLTAITDFNCVNRKDKISPLVYGHLLEMVTKIGSWKGSAQGKKLIVVGTENNEHSCFHDLYWKQFGKISDLKLPIYVENCPREILKNITLIDLNKAASLREDNFKHFSVEMKQELSSYCLDILKLVRPNINRICVCLKLLSIVDKGSFSNLIKSNLIASLHKIDNKYHSIKKAVSRCFSRMAYTPELLSHVLKIYEESEHRKYLGPIKGYLDKMPLYDAKIILKSFSGNSAAHLRKLSLILTQDSLGDYELYELMKEMITKETDIKVKRSLYKKAFFLFLQNQDDSHWTLLEMTIEAGGVNPGYVTEFWSESSKISPQYCEKFLLATLKAARMESFEFRDWEKELLVHLPPGVQDKLSANLLIDLLREVPFHSTKSGYTRSAKYFSKIPKNNYHLDSVFYTSDEKQQLILDFVCKELEVYVAKNWSDFPKKEVFSNVYEFMRAFCKYTFTLKPKHTLVERFYAKWTSLFPSYPQWKFLMLEFLNAYSECQYVVKEFSKKSNQILKSHVARFGEIIFESYCKQLDYFIDAAGIDEFEFNNGLIESDCDPLTYSVFAKILPKANRLYYTEQTKLQHLKDVLKQQENATVKLHFSTYFDRRHTYEDYCNEVMYVHAGMRGMRKRIRKGK